MTPTKNKPKWVTKNSDYISLKLYLLNIPRNMSPKFPELKVANRETERTNAFNIQGILFDENIPWRN